MYLQSVWGQFHMEYHFIRRMLGEIEYLLETRQPIMEELRLDILDRFDDWPGQYFDADKLLINIVLIPDDVQSDKCQVEGFIWKEV